MSAIPSKYKEEILHTPEAVVMRNLLRMTWDGSMTVEEANQFMDSLEGFAEHARFWSATLEDDGPEKQRIRNLVWRNGGWVPVATHDQEIKEMLKGEGRWNTHVERRV